MAEAGLTELNPDEEKRFYSSGWGMDEVSPGEGCNRSCLDQSEEAFRPLSDDRDACWMTIDLGEEKLVTGLIIQGGPLNFVEVANRCHRPQWITAMKVAYSTNGEDYTEFDDPFDVPRESEDVDEKVPVSFPESVTASHIKIIPTEYKENVAIRAGVIVDDRERPDAMTLANIVADYREQFDEVMKADGKMEEMVDASEYNILILNGNIEDVSREFAEGFVEAQPLLYECEEAMWMPRCQYFQKKFEKCFEEKVQACDEAMVAEVFNEDFPGNFEEMIGTADGDEGTLEDVFAAKVQEIADAWVEAHEWVNRIPDAWDGVKDEAGAELLDQFKTAWLDSMADAQTAEIEAAIDALYEECLPVREAQYMFEMTLEDGQEEFDASTVMETIDVLKEKIEEMKAFDTTYVERAERGDILDAKNAAVEYCSDEAGYIRTRADRTVAKGARRPQDAYANVRQVSACVGNNLDRITFQYTDGTYRTWGRDGYRDNRFRDLKVEEGEHLVAVRSWEKDKGPQYGEGMEFDTNTGRELEFRGKNSKGGIFKDREELNQKFDHDQCIIDLEWPEKHHVLKNGVTVPFGRVPPGDWSENVDDYTMAAPRLMYTIGDAEKYFIPLPFEQLTVEGGRILVSARLMD